MSSTEHMVLLIPVAYLMGCVPFGLLVGLAKGKDPRKLGSGNIGATNVGRILGARYFALVFTLDVLKGLLPTAAAAWAARAAPDRVDTYVWWIMVGFAAIVGHTFNVFLKFKGGKGVATSAGVMLGLFPYYTWPGLAAIAVWLVLFAITRYVSVASMLGAISFPVAYAIIGAAEGWPVLGAQLPLLGFAILVPALIVYTHRQNLAPPGRHGASIREFPMSKTKQWAIYAGLVALGVLIFVATHSCAGH